MKRSLAAIAVLLVTVLPSTVSAGAYLCTDATGKKTYQQNPCPASSNAQSLNIAGAGGAGGWDVVRTVKREGTVLQEISLSASQTKTIGGLKRAYFKDVSYHYDGPTLRNVGTSYFYDYYDCSGGKLSRAVLEEDRTQKEAAFLIGNTQELLPYDNLLSRGWYMADPQVVARVCGS